MAELAAHIGRESEIHALGTTWRIGRWDRGIWRKFLDWARTQLPDPVEEALKVVDRLPEKVANALVQKALEEKTAFLSIGSPKVTALLQSMEGGIYLLYLLLQKNHPGITEDDAMEIVMEYGVERLQERFDQAAGVAPQEGNAQAPAG
jgi:hypothetical protein